MPAHPGGRVRIPGHHARYVATTGPLPGRRILVVLVLVAVLLGLLWVPVLGDRLTSFLSRTGPRVAPRMFFLGLGLLVTGLVIGVRALDIAGACLIGLPLLGLILDKY
jgi:hypothetical protein